MRRWALRILVFLLLAAVLQYIPLWLEVRSIGHSHLWFWDWFLFLETGVNIENATGRILYVDVRGGTPMTCVVGREPGGITILWWPAMANVIIWAAVMASIASGFGLLRREIRRANGLCPKCGYDLRGSSAAGSTTCPECGATR